MDIRGRTTVYFEDPFWVAVCEVSEGGKLRAARVVFGAEPKDYEVYGYFLDHWRRLRFSPPVPDGESAARQINPKRMQREIARGLARTGTGTKAQQAVSLMRGSGARAQGERKGARRRGKGAAVRAAPAEEKGKAPGPLGPRRGKGALRISAKPPSLIQNVATGDTFRHRLIRSCYPCKGHMAQKLTRKVKGCRLTGIFSKNCAGTRAIIKKRWGEYSGCL